MTVILFPRDGESLADLIKVTADLTDTHIREVKTTYGGVVVDDQTALAYLSGRSELSNVDDTDDSEPDTEEEDKPARSRSRSRPTSSDTSGSGRGRSGRSRTAKEKA